MKASPFDGKASCFRRRWYCTRRPLAKAAGFREGVHKWDVTERAQLRAELDAAYFHLYGLDREEVDYVLDQFQGVVKEDAATGSPGPTRRAILEAYDDLPAR